jgi:hypothetical protein
VQKTIRVLLVLSVGLWVVAAGGQDTSPAEQFQALRKEYDRPPGAFPKTDDERVKYVHDIYKHHNAVAPKLLALAEKYPADPVALDALLLAVRQVDSTPWPVELVGKDTARARAFELLQRDHVRSDKLGPLCQRVAYGFAGEYEAFLRAVAQKNPHRDIRAVATVSLAHYLDGRLGRVELCRGQADIARQFGALYGKEYVAGLMRQDGAAAAKEVEAVFERAAGEYGDVKLPDGDIVAERAKAELFDLRNLRVGKQAPDIEGVDQDGKRFKLSDYRGKVVLLDFWSFV